MRREDVPARANAAGAAITEGLTGRPGIASVRGMGLLLAVELDGVPAADVARLLLERGVVVNAVSPTALRLAPSLLISDDEVKLAVASIVGAIADELAN